MLYQLNFPINLTCHLPGKPGVGYSFSNRKKKTSENLRGRKMKKPEDNSFLCSQKKIDINDQITLVALGFSH